MIRDASDQITGYFDGCARFDTIDRAVLVGKGRFSDGSIDEIFFQSINGSEGRAGERFISRS